MSARPSRFCCALRAARASACRLARLCSRKPTAGRCGLLWAGSSTCSPPRFRPPSVALADGFFSCLARARRQTTMYAASGPPRDRGSPTLAPGPRPGSAPGSLALGHNRERHRARAHCAPHELTVAPVFFHDELEGSAQLLRRSAHRTRLSRFVGREFELAAADASGSACVLGSLSGLWGNRGALRWVCRHFRTRYIQTP